MSSSLGLLVTLEAKPGKQAELAEFLNTGLSVVVNEPDTITWYAFRVSETSFGIYDTFADTQGREAHLSGEVAAALGEISADLLAGPPEIKMLDVLAAK